MSCFHGMMNPGRILVAPGIGLAWIASVALSLCGVPQTTQAVEIREADRIALHPSEPTEVTLTGQDLRNKDGQIAKLWCSVGATIQPIDGDGKDRNRVRYRISLNEPAGGVVALRAFDANSVSQAVFFTVDAVPTRTLPANDGPAVDYPVGFDVTSPSLGQRQVAVNCRSGKRIIAEIIGARIGSEVDALLVLRDKDGRQVAFSDDHLVTGSDPILQYTAAYDGTHYLVFQDVEYRGGLRMRLRIAEETVAGISSPTAVHVGAQQTSLAVTRLIGPSIDVNHAPAQTDFLGLGYAADDAVFAPVVRTEWPVHRETDTAKPQPPVVLAGRLGQPGEVDSVVLSAKQGQQLAIRSESLDGPFIGQLDLFRGDTRVAGHNWGADQNGLLRFTVPEDGDYRLSIREAIGRGGPEFGYCFSVLDDRGTLKLSSTKNNNKPQRQVWRQGETLRLKLRAERRGYDGPIEIHAMLDGEACPVDESIPAKRGDGEIQLQLPLGLQNNPHELPSVKMLKIYGTCEHNGQMVHWPLDLTEHTKKLYPAMTALPACVGSAITVVVAPQAEERE